MIRRDDKGLLFFGIRFCRFRCKIALSVEYRLKGELSLLPVNCKHPASYAVFSPQQRGGEQEKDQENNVYSYMQHGPAWKNGNFFTFMRSLLLVATAVPGVMLKGDCNLFSAG